MDKKSEYKKIYKESFADSREFVDMFFSEVYHDDNTMLLEMDNSGVSGLMLLPYKMTFHKQLVPVSYVCGAATLKKSRGKGFMTELLKEAIRKSADDGNLFVTLIPASRPLFGYYDKFGFNTVFYIQEERYTPVHKFIDGDGIFSFDKPAASSEAEEAFLLLNSTRPYTFQHSSDNYKVIVKDIALDGGETVVTFNNEAGTVDAIAFAVKHDNRIIVRDILSATDMAREATLNRLMTLYPGLPMTVVAMPDDTNPAPIQARGMARIADALKVLEAVAAQQLKLRISVRLHDSLIPQNNHIYTIDNGKAVINDGYSGKLDLDVSHEVLLSILFSTRRMGNIFNLDTHRPFMSLMLE